MIPVLALMAAAAASAPSSLSPQDRFDACVKLADTAPGQAVANARKWAGSGGGVPAGQCLGLAQSANGDWAGAAESFAATADLAETMHDGRAANLWVSAGNAALAGGQAARARDLLGRAIALPVLADPMRGEAYMDRARAEVALNTLPPARADMDEALKLVAADPMAWLLSATLARRMNDPDRARHDITEASNRVPNEPAVLFESGNIAAAAGDMGKARSEWARAHAIDPGSDAGEAAAKELAATGGVPAAPPTPVKPGR